MKISISFPTIRLGWLENTFAALGAQTFPHEDFELVMIDDYGDRWEEVLALAKEHQINLKYMKSKPYHWISNRQLGNARNTGLIHSDGQLLVFLDDYSWFGAEWLNAHWRLSRIGSDVSRGVIGSRAVIGVVQAVKYNPGPIKSESDFMFEPTPDERLKSPLLRGTRLYPCPPGWFWTFNASAPLRSIVEVNGYDERFDCAGEDDIDLAARMTRVGLTFGYYATPSIILYHMRHNGGQSRPAPFKPEECHKFTKEMLNVQYDGSWGLLEDNRRKKPWDVNMSYFSLDDARRMREKYGFCKEWRI